MREQQFIDNRRAEFGGNLNVQRDPEALIMEDYSPNILSQYEMENGVPYTVDKLQIQNDYRIDNKIENKVRAVERFILKTIEEEEGRDNVASYENVLERLISKLPEPLEKLVSSKDGLRVLDHIFNEVAIFNNMSGKSFLEKVTDEYKEEKILFYKQQLKSLLTTI